jgi:hypothetical protein
MKATAERSEASSVIAITLLPLSRSQNDNYATLSLDTTSPC